MGKRARSQMAKIFDAGSGYRVVGSVSFVEAELRVKMRRLTPAFDPYTGALLGYRIPGLDGVVDQDLRPMRTTAAISRAEMERNAMERSRTVGLSELHRLERMVNGLPPEDEAERTRAKIRVYPFVGAAKGSILEVWPR